MPPEYLTRKPAAAVAGISVNALKHLADTGQVPTAPRPGARRGWRMFRRSDMLALRRQIEAGFALVEAGQERPG